LEVYEGVPLEASTKKTPLKVPPKTFEIFEIHNMFSMSVFQKRYSPTSITFPGSKYTTDSLFFL